MTREGLTVAAWNDPWVWQVRDLGGPFRATQLLETPRRHLDRELILDLSDVRQVYANGAVPFAAVLAFLRATTDPRLVAAIVDRVTFNADIVETGTKSYRLRTSRTATRGK